jgi:protease PrsW
MTAQPVVSPHVVQTSPPAQHKNILAGLGDRITEFTNTSPLEGFSLGEMFSEVFKSRSHDEVEDYLVAGTNRTTPRLADVVTGWPKPWLFIRVLAFMVIVYVLFLVSMPYFANPRFIPGFMFLGSLAVPLATLVLFFELNTPRNVSFYYLLMLVCLGGILSLIATSIASRFTTFLAWMGPPSAGIVEEFAKLATVIVVCRQVKHKYILNGMLFGAAIGTGFAVFESAGYAQDALIVGLVKTNGWQNFFAQGGAGFLNTMIVGRGWLSPFGHVVWTAIAAGALWRVKKEGVFELRMLNATFWKTFSVPVVCHMLWDSKIAMGVEGEPQVWNYLVTLGLGAISWYVAFKLVQEGLKQVRTMQAQSPAPEPTTQSAAAAVATTT